MPHARIRRPRVQPTFVELAPLEHTQPELHSWLGSHLQGSARVVAIELASRFLSLASRWGESMPVLRRAELDRELAEQVPSIEPRLRWMIDLPVPLPADERLAVGRLLRAMVQVTETSR